MSKGELYVTLEFETKGVAIARRRMKVFTVRNVKAGESIIPILERTLGLLTETLRDCLEAAAMAEGVRTKRLRGKEDRWEMQ